MRALHGIEIETAERARLPGDELRRLDHAVRFPLAQDRFAELERAGLIAQSAPFVRFLEAHPAGAARSIRRNVHGDLYARHVLLDTSRSISGIIDWGDTHLGRARRVHRRVRECQRTDMDAFGMRIDDAALRDAGLTALSLLRETL